MQSNKNNDTNNPVMPRKRKKSFSDEELDESSKNNLEDNFDGYLKDSSGKSIKINIFSFNKLNQKIINLKKLILK